MPEQTEFDFVNGYLTPDKREFIDMAEHSERNAQRNFNPSYWYKYQQFIRDYYTEIDKAEHEKRIRYIGPEIKGF